MAQDKDDGAIELDLDVPETEKKASERVAGKVEAKEEATPEPEAKSSEISADDALQTLKTQLDMERRARIEAENRERMAQANAQKASKDSYAANLNLINGAIDSLSREREIQKVNLTNALANGDHSSVAEIQDSIAEINSKLTQIKVGKEALEKSGAQPIQQVAPPVDPVENFASRLSPRSAAWVRAHPQCVTDQRLMQKMIAAHNLAVADGIPADSDEYFSFVETTMKIRQPDTPTQTESALSSASAPTQRRSAPPAAPVTRSGTGNGSKPNVVRLTSDEREMAQMMQMTDSEYAKHKLALQKEGKLPN